MNTNFYSLWYDPTGNRTRVYRFSSRRSIHSTRPWGPVPLNLNICSMSIPLTVSNFFQSILLHKNWPGGGEVLLKNVQKIVTPTNYVIARTGFALSWTLALWDFRNIFLPNTGEDQKKSYLSAGPPALCHLLNSSLVIALRL